MLSGKRRKHQAEDMIERLQAATRAHLLATGLRPPDHPVWSRGGWKVFQWDPDDIRRTILYIENNPIQARMAAQRWPFVATYDGWPLHPGYSPNSPYV